MPELVNWVIQDQDRWRSYSNLHMEEQENAKCCAGGLKRGGGCPCAKPLLVCQGHTWWRDWSLLKVLPILRSQFRFEREKMLSDYHFFAVQEQTTIFFRNRRWAHKPAINENSVHNDYKFAVVVPRLGGRLQSKTMAWNVEDTLLTVKEYYVFNFGNICI